MAQNVRMPDGTLVRNVPDGLSRDEFLGRLRGAGYNVDQLLTPAQRAEAAKPTTPPPVEAKPEEAPEESGRAWYGLSGKSLTKGFGTQLAEGAKQGVGSVRQSIVDQLPNSIDELPPGVDYEEVDRVGGTRAYWAQVYGITSNEQLKAVKQQATERLKEERKASEARVAEATPDDLTLLEQGIRGGGESILRNALGIAASVATRSPLPALASAGLQTGVESYGEARAEGLTPGQASRYAGIDAAIEVGTELLPTKFLLDAFGAKTLKGVKGEILKFAAGEMTGEQVATAAQSLNAYLNDLDKELAAAKTPAEKIEIQARRQALTGIATIVSGGTFAAGAAAAGAIAERRAGVPPEEAPPELEPETVESEAAPPSRAEPREVAPELRGIEALEVPPEVPGALPPAVVSDAQELLKLADEGKPIVLFRAKSLAKQLGIELEKNANKETTLNALREALAPAAVAPTVEAAPEEAQVPKAAQIEPPTLAETVRVYHSGSQGEGETGRWVSTDKEYAKSYRPDLPLFYTDIPANDPRVRNLDYPDQGVEQGFTFNFELTPEEATQLKPVKTTTPPVEVPSEPVPTGVSEAVAGPAPRGVELPVSRVEPAGPEAARPSAAGLEPVSVAAPRVDEGEAVSPAALEPAPTEQRFLNLDRLNAATPPVPEQTREKAPSLRRELGKAKSQYDVGKMTADDFANRAGELLLKTQKERIVQPRQRGAEFIRERLMNASRRGELPPEGVEIASWFIQQNPVLVDDLGISITKRPESMEGVAGYYNDVTRVVKLFKEGKDPDTATHEILHHLERLMPTNIRAGIYKAYTRQLLKAQKKAKTPAEKAFFDTLVNNQYGQLSDFAYQKAIQDIQTGKVSRDNYQYVNPSEFWAVNASRIVQNRYGVPPTITGQLKRWLREFLEKVKSVLNLKSDAAVIRALDSLAKSDGKYQTGQMLLEAPVYLSVQPGKKPHDIAELRRKSLDTEEPPNMAKRFIEFFQERGLYEGLVEKFQNKHRAIDKLDREKELLGKLVIAGPDRNNIASEIARAPNITDDIITKRVDPIIRDAQDAIKKFARATKLSAKDAVAKIEAISIALHEARRRETKYLRYVPLRNDIKLPASSLPFVPAGTADMTPADYRAFLETMRSKLPPEQAVKIQDVMRVIVNKFKSESGYSPKSVRGKKMSTDINDKIYDVIPRGTKKEPMYSPEALKAKIDEYNNSGELKPLIDDVRSKVRRVNELERELSMEANYWTPQVDSVVASYQWGDTYVPFQGIPESDKEFDYTTERLSGELAEVEQSFDGRTTDFSSPTLQSFANAYYAASRAGRKDLMPVLVNNIKQGFIKVKSKDPEIVTFDERNNIDFDLDVLRGKRKVLDYQPNGDVHVYELADDRQLEAIKTPYKESNLAVKIGSNLNSWIGQFHTRFNPNFPPMDFLVNSMTNMGLITSKEGFGQGARYAAEVIGNVLRTGLMIKSANLSRALSSKNPAVLQKLLKSKDGFYRDAMDFIQYGGRSLYRQGFTIDSQLDDLVKRVGPTRTIVRPEDLTRWFDIFSDAFEFTSRVAAYTTRLNSNIAKARSQDINVDDPNIMADLKREAAGFALELMNFRKIGQFGREMSALYMFFKPAATGAVNFIDVIRTARYDAETAIKNSDPRVWSQMDTRYEEEALKEEEAKPKPDSNKIVEIQNRINEKNENRRVFIENYNQRRKNALVALPIFMAAGAAMYSIAMAMAPDDDEGRNKIATDELSRWTRYMRLPVLGKDEFLQLPWGFGAGAFAAAGAQFAALAAGNATFEEFGSNMIEIALDSFMPLPASRINPFDNFAAWALSTAAPSAARPFLEYTMNMDSLGNPIYDSRIGKYADAYSGGSRPAEWHNTAARVLLEVSNGEVDWEPDTIAFLLNNYADGPNAIVENAFNLAMINNGEKELDLKRDLPFIKRFVGKMSNYDASQFREAEQWIKPRARVFRTFRDYAEPEQLDRYLEAHPNIDILTEAYESVINGQLREIGTQKKQIQRDPTLTPKERKEYLDDIQYNEDAIKRNFVETYEYYRFSEE